MNKKPCKVIVTDRNDCGIYYRCEGCNITLQNLSSYPTEWIQKHGGIAQQLKLDI